MAGRLKFYGWGLENTGFDQGEKDRLFRFIKNRLGVEARTMAPPQVSDIALTPSRVQAPASLAAIFSTRSL